MTAFAVCKVYEAYLNPINSNRVLIIYQDTPIKMLTLYQACIVIDQFYDQACKVELFYILSHSLKKLLSLNNNQFCQFLEGREQNRNALFSISDHTHYFHELPSGIGNERESMDKSCKT